MSFFPSGHEFYVHPSVPKASVRRRRNFQNLLAKRMAALVQLMWLAGAYSSIENPLKSILWDLKSYQKLAKQDGVKFIEVGFVYVRWYVHGAVDSGDMCSQVVPHKHVLIQSKVYDYKQKDTVWFTSLANEHPEQWCTSVTMSFKDALAKGFDLRGEGDEAEPLGGFIRVFLQGHGRTRTTAGARGSPHRCYWVTQDPPTTQLLVPGLFAKQGCVHVVSSSRLQGTQSSIRRS